MSTHLLDVSGQRPTTLVLNDPARSAATFNAKQGDDVRFQIGGAREVRIGLPPGAKLEVREYVSKTQKLKDGKAVKDEQGEYVYDEKPYTSLFLVCQGVTVFARSSFIEEPAEGETRYEPTPHSTLYVKRLGAELDFSESGRLLAEHDLAELVG